MSAAQQIAIFVIAMLEPGKNATLDNILWFAIRTPVVRGKENVFDVFRLQECINDVCEDTLQVDKLYLLLLETPMRILHSELKLDLQKRKHKNVIMQ